MIDFIFIVCVHFIADFIFQAEVWANNKSKDSIALVTHTAVYSLVWLVLLQLYWLVLGVDVMVEQTLLFVIITFLCHTVTDYYTSKVVAKKFASQHYGSSIPNFGAFTIIGFDQVLHYVQLVLTWTYIFN